MWENKMLYYELDFTVKEASSTETIVYQVNGGERKAIDFAKEMKN